MARVSKARAFKGRKSGGHNKGYWYRKGRGWYVSEGEAKIPLTDQHGNHIKEGSTPDDVLKDAYARYRLGLDEQAKRKAIGGGAIVGSVCEVYLNHSRATDRETTFTKRGEFLFNFCSGLSFRFWDYGIGRQVPTPTENDYIHSGYANSEVASLIPMDIQNWLDNHPTWGKGTRRIAVQSVKRAFNYAVEMGLIPSNPIKGFVAGVGGKRITYFDDKQEEAIYKYASKPLGMMVRVCIKTGARYGSEYACLTAKHIEEAPQGMIWRFSPDEQKTGSKTKRDRVIYVPAEIAELVRQQVKKYPKGAIFRNSQGTPWKVTTVKENFSRLRRTLKKNGVTLDKDAVMYSCRHTYAKRMLGGYWTGEAITLEVLAGLMGNTPQVCYDHYAKWCESYNTPLFRAINGTGNKKD